MDDGHWNGNTHGQRNGKWRVLSDSVSLSPASLNTRSWAKSISILTSSTVPSTRLNSTCRQRLQASEDRRRPGRVCDCIQIDSYLQTFQKRSPRIVMFVPFCLEQVRTNPDVDIEALRQQSERLKRITGDTGKWYHQKTLDALQVGHNKATCK